MSPAIKAVAATKTLDVQLFRAAKHLSRPVLNPAVNIEVTPSANYAINVTPVLELGALDVPWVSVTQLEPNVLGSKHSKNLPLQFNLSSIADGTKLNASLSFSGITAHEGMQAKKASIRLSGLVSSVPSLVESEMSIPPETKLGRPVRISIEARDEEGLLIDEARSR